MFFTGKLKHQRAASVILYPSVDKLFALGPRIIFPLESRVKEPLLAPYLKTSSQYSLSLIEFIQT
jgi:hypothetical protein